MTEMGRSKIYKHHKAATLYVTIPADVVKDSQFKLKAGDWVIVSISQGDEGVYVWKDPDQGDKKK